MGHQILIVHADGEETLAEQLAGPIRKAGYAVSHRGLVLVGESLVETAQRALVSGCPVVFCGTVKAVGSKWTRHIVNAARMRPGGRVFVVAMEADADVESVSFDERIARHWEDPDKAVQELIASLQKYYPVAEVSKSSASDPWSAESLPPGIYLWQEKDQPPDTIRRGGILTGQRPQVHQLREGFFADRPKVYEPLAESAVGWIEQYPTMQDPSCRVPIFWIAGRSGSGKSVALLHVLARLHKRGYQPILWLGDKVHVLPAAIRWARQCRQPDRPVLIAIDDPYTPMAEQDAGSVWREALTELESARQDYDPSGLPMILCCGPTEQSERLAEAFIEDVNIQHVFVPIEQGQELALLREWYRQRVGEQPPAIEENNVLLVQLFYEWKAGKPLKEFASRFRNRLQDHKRDRDLTKVFCQLLALNRLYVGYPSMALQHILTPEQEGRLARLREELHLAEDTGLGRSGLWLAHPHLANVMYESWQYSIPERREHLRAALQDCFHYGTSPSERTAPLWAIADALLAQTDQNDLARRIDVMSVRDLLPQLYQEWGKNQSHGLPLALLPVWIQIRARWATLKLAPDPIAEAIKKVHPDNLQETGLRLTCHKLLEHYNSLTRHEQRQVLDRIVRLLESAYDWYEWHFVARDAFVKTNDVRLFRLLTEWLHRKPAYHAGWIFVWEALWKAPPDDAATPTLAHLAMQWLVRVPLEHGSWTFIWEALWKAPANDAITLAHLAMQWLVRVPLEHGSWAFIWEALWKAPPAGTATPTLAHLAMQWLTQVPERHGSWGHVWEALWRAEPNDVDRVKLLEHAMHWLEKFSAEPGSWAFVWEAIWKVSPEGDASTKLTRLAVHWLTQTPVEHGSWAFIWQALRRASLPKPEASKLKELALDWLTRAPAEHGSWTYVWQALWRASLPDPAASKLKELALDWLTRAPAEHGSWNYVWQALWGASLSEPAASQLKELAFDWLARVPAKQSPWPYVWQVLWEASLPELEANKTHQEGVRYEAHDRTV